MLYRGKIEFEFESDLFKDELIALLQPVLIEYNWENDSIRSITFDNVDSNKLSIIEYLDTNVIQLCKECGSKIGNRIIDLDGTNLEERLVCLNKEDHLIY